MHPIRKRFLPKSIPFTFIFLPFWTIDGAGILMVSSLE
jgi:hypothetical protein